MRAQGHALLGLRPEILHQPRPEQARGAQLRDLHEEIHADGEEEGKTRREGVDVEAGRDAGAHIFNAVGERVAQFEIGRGAGLLHVIAGDRDRVELRHMLGGIGENIRHDAHRRVGRVDVGVAHHEFFEDVVLDRAGQLFGRHALLFRRDDEERENRQHRAVHGHRHGHLIERNAVEQRAHVIDRVDRDARHADVAHHARMVGIIAAMGREIEGDGEALLSGGEVAPVEGVRVLGRGEARILADRPGLGDIHRRIGSAHVRRDAGIAVDEGEALDILGAIGVLHLDPFRRQPAAGLRLLLGRDGRKGN